MTAEQTEADLAVAFRDWCVETPLKYRTPYAAFAAAWNRRAIEPPPPPVRGETLEPPL